MLAVQGLTAVQRSAHRQILNFLSCRLSSSSSKIPELQSVEAKKTPKKKEVHISLIHPDKTITHTTLENATKLSNRRDLKLIKVMEYDRKRDCPVYQLMTATQYRENTLHLKKSEKTEANKKGPYKGEKLVVLNAKIEKHDLESKLHKIESWLEKSYEARVTISNSKDEDLAEKVFKQIEEFMTNKGRILQKRSSASDIKFTIAPPKRQPPPKTQSSQPKNVTEENSS